MAGGPFDNALSSESENAVQNKIIKAQVDRLDQAISDALALRASLTEFGLGKICPVSTTDITENNGIMLGGIEKNPAIEGTLANSINKISKNVNGKKILSGYAVISTESTTQILFQQGFFSVSPSIVCSPISNLDGAIAFPVYNSISKDGFWAKARIDNYSGTLNMSWIAIGE